MRCVKSKHTYKVNVSACVFMFYICGACVRHFVLGLGGEQRPRACRIKARIDKIADQHAAHNVAITMQRSISIYGFRIGSYCLYALWYTKNFYTLHPLSVYCLQREGGCTDIVNAIINIYPSFLPGTVVVVVVVVVGVVEVGIVVDVVDIAGDVSAAAVVVVGSGSGSAVSPASSPFVAIIILLLFANCLANCCRHAFTLCYSYYCFGGESFRCGCCSCCVAPVSEFMTAEYLTERQMHAITSTHTNAEAYCKNQDTHTHRVHS